MLNTVNLMGRLAKDPELRFTTVNQTPVASCSIAVNRRIAQGKKPVTDFFNLVAWNGTAEFLTKNFIKGQPICIDGRLQQSTWTDPETKATRYSVEVVAESVHFAGFLKNDVRNNNASQSQAEEFDPYASSGYQAAA